MLGWLRQAPTHVTFVETRSTGSVEAGIGFLPGAADVERRQGSLRAAAHGDPVRVEVPLGGVQPDELHGTPGIEQADRNRRADLLLDRVAHRPHLHGDHGATLGEELVDRRVFAGIPKVAEPDHDRERCGALGWTYTSSNWWGWEPYGMSALVGTGLGGATCERPSGVLTIRKATSSMNAGDRSDLSPPRCLNCSLAATRPVVGSIHSAR